MNGIAIASLVVASVTLFAGLVTLGLMCWQISISKRQERRELERALVLWSPIVLSPGKFKFLNNGPDTAHDVSVEVWTTTEIGRGESRKLGRGESVTATLPQREKNGPEPVDLPPRIRPPRFDPPRHLLGEQIDHQDDISKQMDAAQSQVEERIRRQAEATQVQYLITWKTGSGKWQHDSGTTG